MSPSWNTTFTYFGHSCLLIKTPTGKHILLDPFLTGNPACPEALRDLGKLPPLDLILLTHIHGDHCADAIAIAQANPTTPIVSVVEVSHWLSKKELANPLGGMNKGGTQAIGDIRITMTHAEHTSSFVEEDGTLVFGGEPAGYVLRLENGFTFYAAGDTALFGDMALLAELYSPELALLPIGDHYTMGPREAAYALRLLKVGHVIPIHYATFPILTGTPEALDAHIKELGLSVTVHALKPGESLA